MDKRIPVVYILSNGRSGSTLLDLLLGAHPNVWTLGEAQNLPWELVNPRAPHGHRVEESAFWRGVLPDIPTGTEGYHIGYFRGFTQTGKVVRWNLLPDVVRGRVSPAWRQAVEEYGARNAQYFEAVRPEARRHKGNDIYWLVDASKDPYRLFWLQQSGRFDLRVIHLVKDPRALVFSMTKDVLPRATRKVVRYTGRWLVENAIMVSVCRSSIPRAQVRNVTYEQLASRPEETLAEIGDWLGVAFTPEMIHGFRHRQSAAVAGNRMRWKPSDTHIRLDETWKTAFPRRYAWFTDMATRPFAKLCGYTPFQRVQG